MIIKSTKITKPTKSSKPKLGIFSLTSCDGCQITLLDMDEDFLKIANDYDIIDFALIKDGDLNQKVDVAIIEGAPIKTEEINKLKKIRKQSKTVLAIGTCATFGGVGSMRDYDKANVEKASYDDTSFLDLANDVKGVGEYIKIDYYIRGCPPTKDEIKRVLEDLNSKPYELPVCVECRKNGNPCFLKENKRCMGSITYGGCDSICVNNKFPCYGCRGPLPKANADGLFKILKDKVGMSDKEIKNMFMLYAGSTKRYKDIIEK